MPNEFMIFRRKRAADFCFSRIYLYYPVTNDFENLLLPYSFQAKGI